MSRKNTLQEVKNFIEEQYPQSIVLSTIYTCNSSKLKISCPFAHIFYMSLKDLRRGNRCPICRGINQSRKQTLNFDFVKNRILQKHPFCEILSDIYENYRTPITIKCEKGHFFQNDYDHIINAGQWCSECSPSKQLTLTHVIGIIKEKHPHCKIHLQKYVNNRTKFPIICENGHEFMTNASNIKMGYWCNKCKNLKTRATCIKKYGVDNPSKQIDIILKIAKRVNLSTLKTHWKTGRKIVCVGSYEAKTVDYLNSNRVDYEWQPKVFNLSKNKTYLPDLYLVKENLWVEIKGYFRKDAQEKWEEFRTIQINSQLWNQKKLKEMGIL